MNISEIFYSLQGESLFSGRPCLFVRLSGCNLGCSWCDTRWSHHIGPSYSVEEILAELSAFPAVPLVEITGGEPLCQPQSYELMNRLLALGKTVLLETNGTMDLSKVPPVVHKIVDVKCPSAQAGRVFLKNNLTLLQPGVDELKFVLACREDFLWAAGFCRRNRLSGGWVTFSPVWDRLTATQLAAWIMDEALDVRLGLPLHKLLWPGEECGR